MEGLVRLRGHFTIKQTDFGIHPYSKLGGAVAVADEVKIAGDIWLSPPPRSEPGGTFDCFAKVFSTGAYQASRHIGCRPAFWDSDGTAGAARRNKHVVFSRLPQSAVAKRSKIGRR